MKTVIETNIIIAGAVPFLEDGLIFYGVARDISDKKQTEVALRRVNQKLETAITQSITQLNHVHKDLFTEIIECRRVEIALRKSESLYRTLVETIPHGIGEADATGTITFANSALHTILGYAQGEMVGKRIWDFIPEPERFTFPIYQ
jgi:PAS domain-containing protein